MIDHVGLKKDKPIYIYSAIIVLIIIAAVFAEKISGCSPFAIDFSGASAPGRGHLFGTDFLGRDIFSRTLIGGRISILIGLVARLGTVIAGIVIGVLIGMAGRRIRPVFNGVVEVFLSIPALLLAIGLAVSMGEGYRTIIVSIIAGTWAPVARFVAVKVAEIRNYDFVSSAVVIGAGKCRVITRYIFPSLVPLLLPLLTTGIATSIMLESTLSFLGLAGTSSLESLPSWGLMIQEGSKFLFDAPWMIIPPSLMLTVFILCFNSIGDRLVGASDTR